MLVLGAGPGGYSAAFRAADLGMKTVLLVPQDEHHEFVDAWERRSEDDKHIDYATSNLTAFLNALL